MLLLSCCFVRIVAYKTHRPLLKEGKVWNCQVSEHFSEIVDGSLQSGYRTVAFSLVLSGDSIVDGRTYTLLSCYEDGSCIFTAEDFNAPSWHDGTDGVIVTNTVTESKSANVYGLQGHRLDSTPRRGLIIKNGNKYLVK